MKVVIVEDEIRIREGLARLIRKLYPQVEEVGEARSGEEGIRRIREIRPDIVITDIRMETMDGLEMLRKLNEDTDLKFKSVILSAYSEFEYAKQAISLGVTEYLIKPVEIEELHQIMRRLEAEIQEEKRLQSKLPCQLRSLENVLHSALAGKLEANEELGEFLKTNYCIDMEMPEGIFCIYLGRRFEEEKAVVMSVVQNCFVKSGYKNTQILMRPEKHEIMVIIFEENDFHKLERYVQYIVLPEIKRVSNFSAVGFTVCGQFTELQNAAEHLWDVIPWSIPLGNDVLISYPKVLHVNAAELIYPSDLEEKCTNALFKLDYEELNRRIKEFLNYFTIQLYNPEEIKKSVLRFSWGLLAAAKEVNFQGYQKMDEKNLVEKVSQAVTLDELEMVVYTLAEVLVRREEKAVGLIVRKAQRIVEEYYRQGITLEEIAAKLGVSPEHISSQFKKELGMNFSRYYHDFRLDKAKSLLKESDLKVYQVAAQAGYKDAKYFSKVFREAEGELPLEYRKRHR